MNEIEIVVKSTDRTDLEKIAAASRGHLLSSMRKTYDDLDRETTRHLARIGEDGGERFGVSLEEQFRTHAEHMTESVDVKIVEKFRKVGDDSGKALSKGLDSGVRDVEKTFGRSFQAAKHLGGETDGLAAQFKELGAQWKLVGIVNGLALLPELASVAGGAISLGLGGALVGVALKAQMANKDVKRSFADTKKDIVGEFTNISAPFHSVLLHMSRDADVEFSTIAPSLKRAFAEMAPATDRFSHFFIASLSQLNPFIESLGHAFSRVTDNLGPHMGDVMHNIATGLKAITDATAANPGALTGTVEGFSKMFRYLGDGIGILIRFKDQFETLTMVMTSGGPLAVFKMIDGLVSLKDKITGVSHSLETGGGEFKSFGEQAASGGVHLSALDKDMKTLASTTADATAKANALSDAFNRLLNPAEAVFKDTANLKESIKAMSDALADSHGKINDTTAAARASKQAFGGMIDNAKTLASDMLNSGKSIGQVRSALQPTIAQMYAFAGSNKEARALVDRFVQSLDGMPDNKRVGLTLDAQDFFSALHQANHLKLDPKTGLLKGDNADYLNTWLKTNRLRIDPKTGLLKGNNANYYNAWLKANHLRIDPKTGIIKGNTAPFWKSVHSLPRSVGSRVIDIYAQMHLSEAQAYANKLHNFGYAHGGIVGHAAEGGPRSNMTLVGENGPELVDLPSGSRVRSNPDTRAAMTGGGTGVSAAPIYVTVQLGTQNLGEIVIDPLRRSVRKRGGNVQAVLGSHR